MNKFRFVLQSLAVLVFSLAFVSLAQAQATRTWVSGVGDDVNPCSRTAPCKTFSGAISKTAANGEINAIDPGGFGTITITKSITIDGAGTNASILNSGGINGVVINDSASGAPGTISVRLRNLNINGGGSTIGLNGISFVSGKSLLVENVRIMNQSSNGINVNTTQVISVTVDNTQVSNCTGSGFSFNDGSGLATLRNSEFKNNGTGILDTAGVVNISNCNVSSNGTGINATTSSSLVHADNNIVSNNTGTGINVASAAATVRLSNNDVWRNAIGLSNSGLMETYRNNRVRGSIVSNVSGVLTDVSAVNTGTF